MARVAAPEPSEKVSEESMREANQRLEEMRQSGRLAGGSAAPAPATQVEQQEQTSQQENKRTRTTVASLAERYQDRIKEMSIQIAGAEQDVAAARDRLKELQLAQSVWQAALDEIS